MTAFDAAWSVAKAPLWTPYRHPSPLPKRNAQQFGMADPATSIPEMFGDRRPIRPVSKDPRFWESEHKDARGYAIFREGDAPDDPIDPYHTISMFEMARDARGKGLMRDRLQEMIAELKGHDEKAVSTHVTHSERDTADLWDKLVDEGLIDSASTKPYVTTTPEGRLIPKTG